MSAHNMLNRELRTEIFSTVHLVMKWLWILFKFVIQFVHSLNMVIIVVIINSYSSQSHNDINTCNYHHA